MVAAAGAITLEETEVAVYGRLDDGEVGGTGRHGAGEAREGTWRLRGAQAQCSGEKREKTRRRDGLRTAAAGEGRWLLLFYGD
jgi:hypothetical protein